MSLINHENVIRITKGFMKNYLIPVYRLLAPYRHKEMQSLVSTSDYIYGKHLIVNGEPVNDIWEILPALKKNWIPYCTFDNPNQHQKRFWDHKTYHSLTSGSIPTYSTGFNFEDLYEKIYNTFFASKFPHAFLTSYDMAYRIGYNMNPQVLPCKYVYLTAGAYKGAERLFGKQWIIRNEDKSFKQRKKDAFVRIERNKFFYKKKNYIVDYFDGISSAEVEDMLCIFFDVKK